MKIEKKKMEGELLGPKPLHLGHARQPNLPPYRADAWTRVQPYLCLHCHMGPTPLRGPHSLNGVTTRGPAGQLYP